MRLTSLSTPTYSTPRRAGLQAQASTANVAQAQKAEAFTPSGRLQRQGKTTRKHVEMLIDAIDKHLKEALDAGEIKLNSLRHHPELRQQRQILQDQLEEPSKKGIDRLIEWISGGRKFSCQNGYFVGLDLQEADLAGIDLRGSNLLGIDFTHADLRGAKLQGADLRGAILRKADLRFAQLQGAKLRYADLSWTRLWFSRFQAASLKGANLQDADLLQTPLLGNPLKDADLKGAFGYVHGLKSLMLEKAKNTDLLGDFMRNYWDAEYLVKYQKLEQERQANVRALLG
jgi:uncharacterized protein YjbI with pentapeptide repeats